MQSTSLHHIAAVVLDTAYRAAGPADGPPVFLVHSINRRWPRAALLAPHMAMHSPWATRW